MLGGMQSSPAPAPATSTPFQLAWGARVSTDFARHLLGICSEFGWGRSHANWLMACMAFESGETFRADVRNAAGSGAMGLIQFMPATARDLGTTTESLAAMTAESQLIYVRAYFRPYARRIQSLSDMYMAILLPKYIGTAEGTVLFSGTGASYRQNAGLDANSDGKITKGEATARVAAMLQRGLEPANAAAYVWP
mgnify:CR=1 FL=1